MHEIFCYPLGKHRLNTEHDVYYLKPQFIEDCVIIRSQPMLPKILNVNLGNDKYMESPVMKAKTKYMLNAELKMDRKIKFVKNVKNTYDIFHK